MMLLMTPITKWGIKRTRTSYAGPSLKQFNLRTDIEEVILLSKKN